MKGSSITITFTEFPAKDNEKQFREVSKEDWNIFDEALTVLDEDIPTFLELTRQGDADLFWEGIEQAEVESGKSLRKKIPPTETFLAALRKAQMKIEVSSLTLKIDTSVKDEEEMLKDVNSPEFQLFAAVIFNVL